MTDECTFGGWAVSTAIYRDGSLYTRPFTISTFERADAERYAHDEVARDYPPEEGWTIIVSAMSLWWVSCQELPS